MGLRGNIGTLSNLKKTLRKMPITMAQNVAHESAPKLNKLTRRAYDSGQTVYGDPRPLGVEGDRLSLKRTGATRSRLLFTVTGTIVRAVLGTRYAKYLIGKYEVLPNGRLPSSWEDEIREIVKAQKVDL